jgi:hypothetical protein
MNVKLSDDSIAAARRFEPAWVDGRFPSTSAVDHAWAIRFGRRNPRRCASWVPARPATFRR